MSKVIIIKPEDLGYARPPWQGAHSPMTDSGLTKKDLKYIHKLMNPPKKPEEKKPEKKSQLSLVETWAVIALAAWILGPFIYALQTMAMRLGQ